MKSHMYTYDREATEQEIMDNSRRLFYNDKCYRISSAPRVILMTVQEELSIVEALLHPEASVRAQAKRNAE